MSELKYEIDNEVWYLLPNLDIRNGRVLKYNPAMQQYCIRAVKEYGNYDGWFKESELYETELDATKAALKEWEHRQWELNKQAASIVDNHMDPLRARVTELEAIAEQSLSNRTIRDGYYTVRPGQTFSDTVVKSYGCHLGIEGGTMRGLYVTNGAKVHLMSGEIDGVSVDCGASVVVDGGHLVSARVSAGSLCIVGSDGKSPYLRNAALTSGADAYLADAVAAYVLVREHSRMTLSEDAKASNVTVWQGGEVSLHSGAELSSCTVRSGGTLTMYGGGSITDLTVNEGGIVRYLEQSK